MTLPIITFTTDFGLGSPYVAEMKGVALTVCPTARLIDLTHDVPPQCVAFGAAAIAQAAFRFPVGTVHVGVVDPGVGTERKIVAVRAGGQLFVAPDNGLLQQVICRDSPDEIVEVAEPRFWLDPVSATFHGRDIMTPVAAHLASGVPMSELGPTIDCLCDGIRAEVVIDEHSIIGEVAFIDTFGNVISNVGLADLAGREVARIDLRGETTELLVRTYGEASAGELIALFGSSGNLEVAVAMGNAATRLGAKIGDPIRIQFAPK